MLVDALDFDVAEDSNEGSTEVVIAARHGTRVGSIRHHFVSRLDWTVVQNHFDLGWVLDVGKKFGEVDGRFSRHQVEA